MVKNECIFCDLKNRTLLENTHGILIEDKFPVSQGHCLIISKRHISSFFECEPAEYKSLLELIQQGKMLLDKKYCPDGYNIGINDNITAGQTIAHLHIHLIPRYIGDIDDPKGGIRWTIPNKAKYW